MLTASGKVQSGSAGLVHTLQDAEMGDQDLHREVNFLILHALRSGPCCEAAHLLEQQLSQHSLLPVRTDVTGKQSPCRAIAPESVQIWLGLSWSRLSAKVGTFSFLPEPAQVRWFLCMQGGNSS